MVIVVKMCSMAWAYHDGQLPAEELDRGHRKDKRIEKLPSLLEFYSFVYFFAGFLTGPFTEYNHYIAFTNRTVFKDVRAFAGVAHAAKNNGEIPTSWRATFGKLLVTLMAFIMNQLLKKVPDMYTATDEFMTHSLGWR